MRTKKAFKNMLTSLAYQIIAIICGLITPRLILSNFGSTYNGVISSATQFLNMINILTLGITASTRVALYKTLGSNDKLGTSRLIKATKRYMHKVAGCLVVYVLLLCVLYPSFSHNELTKQQTALIIAIVSIGTFADYFFGISNITLLQADQANYVTNLLNIIKVVLNTVCVAVFIKLGASIYIVKLGSSIVYFAAPLFLNIYVKKKYQLIENCEPDDTGIKGRKAVAFHLIANIVHDNTDLVILTLFTDAKQISVYTVYYLVIGKIKSIMQVFTSGLEAAFGDMWAKKEYDSLYRNFRIFEYMMFAFTAVVFSCVGVLILPFIANYTRGVTDVEYISIQLAVLISIAEGMYCVRHPYLTLVYSTGSFEQTKWGAVAEAIINIVVSVICVQIWGIGGVIIGTFVANAFRTAQFAFYVSKNILYRKITSVITRFIWLIGTAGVIVAVSLFVNGKFMFETSWVNWIREGIYVFLIAICITIVSSVIFYKKDFQALVSIGKRVINRRK